MVKRNNFALELINAENEEPFKEHLHSNRKVYAEVEPDLEYYVRITNNSSKEVVIKIYVDGECLGYQDILPQEGEDDFGLWAFNDGISTTSALRFKKHQGVSENRKMDQFLFGKVVAKVFEYIEKDNFVKRNNFQSSWQGSNGTPEALFSIAGKSLKSEKGSCTNTVNESVTRMEYRSGKLLETLSLNYCTTPGLIGIGILPPPLSDDGKSILPQNEERSRKQNRDNIIHATFIICKKHFPDGRFEEQKMPFYDLTIENNPDDESLEN